MVSNLKIEEMKNEAENDLTEEIPSIYNYMLKTVTFFNQIIDPYTSGLLQFFLLFLSKKK